MFKKEVLFKGAAVLVTALLLLAGSGGVFAQSIGELDAQAQKLIQQNKLNEAMDVYKRLTSLHPDSEAGWYNLAVLALRMQNIEGARWGFRNVVRINPKNDTALGMLVELSARAGDLPSLRQHAAALSRLKPKDPNPHFFLGVALLEAGQPAEAIRSLRQCVQLDARNVAGWVNLGIAYTRVDDYNKASESFEKAVAFEPRDLQIRMMAAAAAEQSNKLALAAGHYDQATRLEPNNPGIRLAYAHVLEMQNKPVEALEQYSKAASLDPKSFHAQFNKGRLEFMSSDFRAAEESFAAAFAADPKSAPAAANLALSQVYNGKLDLAETNYKKAQALDPEYLPALEGLAFVYEQTGKLDDAIGLLKKAKPLSTEPEGVDEALARLYERKGDFADSADIWKALAESRNRLTDWRELGRVQQLAGRPQESAYAYRKASELSPSPSQDLIQAAQVYGQAGNAEDAIRILDEVKAKEPDNLMPYFTAATIYTNAAQNDKAIAEYDKVIEKDPKNVNAMMSKAQLLESDAKYEEAIQEYRRTEEIAPDPVTLSNIARLLALQDKPEEAEAEYRRLAEKYPTAGSIWDSLGNLLEKNERLPEAAEAYEKAFAIEDSFFPSLSKAAAICERLGQTDRAIEVYAKQARHAPLRSDALSSLKRLYTQREKPEDYLALLGSLVRSIPEVGLPPYQLFLDEYKEAGRQEEALAIAREVAAQDAQSPTLQSFLGAALRASGNARGTVDLLVPLIQGNWNDPDLNRELGLAYMDLGNLERAGAHLTRAVNNAPFDPEIQYGVGRLRETEGKKDEALAAYRMALSLSPQHRAAGEAVKRLSPEPDVIRSEPMTIVVPEPADSSQSPSATEAPDTGAAAPADTPEEN